MKHMREVLLGLLLVWPHLMSVAGEISNEILVVYLISIVVVCIVSIINAFTFKGDDVPEKLTLWTLLIKLVHIPFYIRIFVSGVLMLPAALLSIMVAFAWAIYLLLFVIDYLFLLSSSAYSVKAIWTAKKQGIIPKSLAVILSIFSFIFVTDIICAVVAYALVKKNSQCKQSVEE